MSERTTVFWNDETQGWDHGIPPAAYVPPASLQQPEHPPHAAESPPYLPPPYLPPPDGASPSLPPPEGQPPAPPGRGGRPGPKAGVVAGVAVAVIAGLGLWFAWGSGDDAPSDARGSEAAPTASATPTGPDWALPTRVPNDGSAFRTALESGFTIVVPASWERRVQEGVNGVSVHYYVDPTDDLRFVQVFPVTEEDMTPTKALELAEKGLENRRNGYRRNSLSPASDHRGPAAELDYSFRSDETGDRVRVLDRVFHADGDTLYAIVTVGHDLGWTEQQVIQAQAVSGFALREDPSSPSP